MTSNAFIDDAALDVAVAAPEEVAVPVLDFVAVEVPLAVPEADEEETLAQSSVATVRVSGKGC